MQIVVPPHSWAKIITGVNPLAKDGYDWEGRFVYRGSVQDVRVGELLVTCIVDYYGRPGKRKRRVAQRVRHIFLWQVMEDRPRFHAARCSWPENAFPSDICFAPPELDPHLRLIECTKSEQWGFYLREIAGELLLPPARVANRKFRLA